MGPFKLKKDYTGGENNTTTISVQIFPFQKRKETQNFLFVKWELNFESAMEQLQKECKMKQKIGFAMYLNLGFVM